jgi:hypothetical protein
MQIESVTVNKLDVLHVLGNACIGVVVARTRQDLQFCAISSSVPILPAAIQAARPMQRVRDAYLVSTNFRGSHGRVGVGIDFARMPCGT